MDSTKINLWIQGLTSLAILIGLGLVIWELQQARTLVQVELSQGTMTDITQDFTALYGDNGARTLAQACFHPEALTEEDAVVLDFFFREQTYRVRRLKLQEDVAGFTPQWKRVAEFSGDFILSFPQGRKWLQNFSATDIELQNTFREVAEMQEVSNCRERYSMLLPRASGA